MRRWLAVFGAILCLAATGASAADASRPIDLSPIDGLIASTRRAEAASALEALISSPDFRAMSSQDRYGVFHRLGVVRLQLGQGPAALAMFKSAIATSHGAPEDWVLRMEAATRAEDFADVFVSFQTLAAESPKILNLLTPRQVRAAVSILGRSSRPAEAEFEVMALLRKAHWAPDNPVGDISDLWVAHALALIERKDLLAAQEAVSQIRSPLDMVRVRADLRFDPVTRADPSRVDPVATAVRRLAELRAAATAHPDRLDILYALSDALVWLGRAEEGQALLQAAIARAEPKAGEKSTFVDAATQLVRVMRNRAMILAYLGRWNEAIAQMEAAAARRTAAGDMTGLVALADIYQQAGRPRETLAVIDRMPPDILAARAEPVLAARICAHAQLGEKEAYRPLLAQFHKVNQSGLSRVVALCTGDLDQAARVLKRDLSNPLMRSFTLTMIQTFRPPPPQGPWKQTIDDRWRKVITRADVQAALARTGRIETYDLALF